MSSDGSPSFLIQHGGVLITAIGGGVATVFAWIQSRSSAISVMQKTLQDGFTELNRQQNEKIRALEAELAVDRVEHAKAIENLRGQLREVEQRNLSLIGILRQNGLDVPRATKVVTVFAPYPPESNEGSAEMEQILESSDGD